MQTSHARSAHCVSPPSPAHKRTENRNDQATPTHNVFFLNRPHSAPCRFYVSIGPTPQNRLASRPKDIGAITPGETVE